VKRKRTEIVVETRTLRMTRASGTRASYWCSQCASEVGMVTPEQAAAAFFLNIRTVYSWIEAGKIHFNELANGPIYICVNSMQRYELLISQM
jgi:hypothetical protein